MNSDPYSPHFSDKDLEILRLRQENERLERGGSVRTEISFIRLLKDRHNWVLAVLIAVLLLFYATGHLNSFWYIAIAIGFAAFMYVTGRRKEILIGVVVWLIVALFGFEVFNNLGSAKAFEISDFEEFTWSLAYGFFVTAVAFCIGWPLIALVMTGTWVNKKLIPSPTEEIDRKRWRQGMFLTIASPLTIWVLLIVILMTLNLESHRIAIEVSSLVIIAIGVALLLLGIHLDRSGNIPNQHRFVERPKRSGQTTGRSSGYDALDPEYGR